MEDVHPTSDALLSRPTDIRELRRRFAGVYQPRPWIYWIDAGTSAVIGWAALAVSLWFIPFTPAHTLCVVVSILALLRGVLFIHELAHLKRGAVPYFELGWHLMIGLPLMVPSLMYAGSHSDHHRRSTFATVDDPEYAPIAHWSRWRLVQFVLGVLIVPLVLPLRWGLVAPLSYLIPPLRRLAVERLSTLVINPGYRRPLPAGEAARKWAVQELGAGAIFWLFAALLWFGAMPLQLLVTWYVVVGSILVLNQIRTLAAHRYENEGEQVDTLGQLMDSINLSGAPWPTVLVAPVGLRYHALHHFMPSVPYHALGSLHRRISAELPSEDPYHRTEAVGILPTIRRLWERAPA